MANNDTLAKGKSMKLKSDQMFFTQSNTEEIVQKGTDVMLAQRFENNSDRILVATNDGSMNWINRTELAGVPKMQMNNLPVGSTFNG